jgi:hypothetical protein
VCFIVSKTTSELEHVIFATLYFASVENTDSWHARRGDLKCAFPLDILMVHSSALAVSIDNAHLSCGGFSQGETICFVSLEFIADCFSGLSLSPRRNDSGAAFMVQDSTKEFCTSSSKEGASGHPSSRRHDTGAPPAPVATTPLEDTLALKPWRWFHRGS